MTQNIDRRTMLQQATFLVAGAAAGVGTLQTQPQKEGDAADIDKKVTCPLLTLWADPGTMGSLYKVLDIWKERGTNVSGKGMTGGYTLREGNPTEVLAEFRAFFKS
jgi:SAM-dependent MidA family methyltransferase